MKFAFETVVWGRRIEDFESVLDAISSLGFEGIEIAQSPDNLFVRDAGIPTGNRPIRDIAELLDLLQKRALKLVGIAGGSLERRMKFCGNFRPQFLYVDDWRNDDPEFDHALNAEPPFTLALHPHMFQRVHSTKEIRLRMSEYTDRHPNDNLLRLVVDTAHLTIVGDDPKTTIDEFYPQLAAVHLKDWTPAFGRYSQRYAHGFVALGDGIVGPGSVLEQLKGKGYKGWGIVAVDYAGHSPIETARACAKWLTANGWMEPRSSTPVPISAAASLPQIQRKTDEASSSARMEQFVVRVLQATGLKPSDFYSAAVDAIQVLGGYAAVALCSYNPRNEELYLLGAAGESRYFPQKEISAAVGLSGVALSSGQVCVFDLTDEQLRARFNDLELSDALPINRFVTVPVFSTISPHHLRFLLHVFPDPGQFSEIEIDRPEIEKLEQLALHLSRLADNMASNACSAASMETSYACGRSRSRSEFLRNLIQLIQHEFQCEGVSVFLANESGSRLVCEASATTGLNWAGELKPQNHYYKKGEGITGTVWTTGEMITGGATHASSASLFRSWESVTSESRREFLCFPMKTIDGRVIGVVRLVNKKKGNSRSSTMFTEDDVAILDSIIHAALPHLEILTIQERQVQAISRMTHEFQMPIVAIKGAADLMRTALHRKNLTPEEEFGQDYISDIIDWSSVLGRLASNARIFAGSGASLRIEASKTRILMEVIEPAIRQMKSMLQLHGFDETRILVNGFTAIPPLWIDRNQFQQVVFNLLSNAIKYAEKDGPRITVSGEICATVLVLRFADWGMGIDPLNEDVIFEPGYRASEAMRRDIAGQGIGLSVVRSIVRAHGGEVRVASCKQPTIFEVRLPTSLFSEPPTRHE